MINNIYSLALIIGLIFLIPLIFQRGKIGISPHTITIVYLIGISCTGAAIVLGYTLYHTLRSALFNASKCIPLQDVASFIIIGCIGVIIITLKIYKGKITGAD